MPRPVILQYHTDWHAPHIHYRFIGRDWTQMPGKAFERSNRWPHGQWWVVRLQPDCVMEGLEFVIHDGSGSHWDKAFPYGENYYIAKSGSYELHGGCISLAPCLDDQSSHIILQGFRWDSCNYKEGWYNFLKPRVRDLAELGFDMIWLPPPGNSVDNQGYLPREWYDLNSKYGSPDELKDLLRKLRGSGVVPIVDLVMSHRCATQKSNDGQQMEFWHPHWSSWAICCNHHQFPGSGGRSTGQEIVPYAPNVDHTNSKVHEDVQYYIHHLKDLGFHGLRFDSAKCYGARFQDEYVKSAGTPFSVADYVSGDVGELSRYIHETNGRIAVFDFPLFYRLRSCVRGNNYSGLQRGAKLYGLIGTDPQRSVTFVDNHDTTQEETFGTRLQTFGTSEQVVRAYAFLLTHPGTPCILWAEWLDRNCWMKDQIAALCKLRKELEIRSDARVNIDAAREGLYAAYIDGHHGTVAFKMGTHDWMPHGYGWELKVSGKEYAAWSMQKPRLQLPTDLAKHPRQSNEVKLYFEDSVYSSLLGA